MTYADHISVRCFDHGRLFLDRSYSHDRYLRLVNDGCSHYVAERSDVGDRVSASLDLVRRKLIVPCSVSKVVHLPGEPGEVEHICILDHRHDQVAAWKSGGHADVDVLSLDDLASVEGNVDHREILDRFYQRFDEDRCEGELFAFAFFKASFHFIPPLYNVGHIGFHKGGHVRGGMLAHYHVVRDQLAHAVHLDDLVVCIHGYCRLRMSGPVRTAFLHHLRL